MVTMSLPSASIEVVNNTNTRFTNALAGDLTMYTNSTTQNIHIGTALSNPSALVVTQSNVQIPLTLELKGRVTHKGTTIISENGDIVGAVPPLPIAGGIMQGQIQGFASDTSSNPSYSWENDAQTGLYNKTSGVMGIACSGVEVASFSNSGATFSYNMQSKGLRLSN